MMEKNAKKYLVPQGQRIVGMGDVWNVAQISIVKGIMDVISPHPHVAQNVTVAFWIAEIHVHIVALIMIVRGNMFAMEHVSQHVRMVK